MTAPLTGPTWYWLSGTTALVLIAWAAVIAIGGAVLGLWARHEHRRQQAAEDQATPGAAPPQPGSAGVHRGPVMRIDMWACGCMWTYTTETGWVREIDCLDDQIERLLSQ